jgi:hypothetical protein
MVLGVRGDLNGQSAFAQAERFEFQKLPLPPGAGKDEEFGASVAMHGDLLAVGATKFGPLSQGGVFVYLFDPAIGWVYKATLTCSECGIGDGFAWSVAVQKEPIEWIVVGAPFRDVDAPGDGRGKVYLYLEPVDGWENMNQTFELVAPPEGDPPQQYEASFGYSVAISENTLVVGAPASRSPTAPPTARPGRAYVFQGLSLHTLVATLATPANHDGARFGHSVSISDGVIIIGAPDFNDGPPNPTPTDQGAAFVYVEPEGGWPGGGGVGAAAGLQGAAQENAHFGSSVSVRGETIVVGAPDWDLEVIDPMGPCVFANVGKAFLFAKPPAGWDNHGGSADRVLQQTNTPQTCAEAVAADVAEDRFGSSVGVAADDRVVVGAPGDESSRGFAYLFARPGDGWAGGMALTPQQKWIASDGGADDNLSARAALAADPLMAVVGAPYHDAVGPPVLANQGAAYIFATCALPIPLCPRLVPAVSRIGLISMCLLVLLCGVLVMRWRNRCGKTNIASMTKR